MMKTTDSRFYSIVQDIYLPQFYEIKIETKFMGILLDYESVECLCYSEQQTEYK